MPNGYGRADADKRFATLMGQWHENRFGDGVQQFIGWNNAETTYGLTDKMASANVPPASRAMEAATSAATAKGKQVAPQFTEGYQYTAKRGEPSDPTEDMLREAGAAVASWVFDAIGLESLARGAKRIIRGDRLANQTILNRNLISRWRNEGAAMELLKGSALRSSRVGQVGAGYERGSDAASNFTTAGFQNPVHNINVDGWNRDYKLRFFKAMGIGDGGSFASKPDMAAVTSSAKLGTNLGQVNPFDADGKFVWKPAEPLAVAAVNDQDSRGDGAISDWINSIFAPAPIQPSHLSVLQSQLKNMKQTFMNNLGPGPRIPVPFNVAINLTDLLRQNLLIPPDVGRREQEDRKLVTGVGFSGDPGKALAEKKEFSEAELTTDPTDRVFQQLYTHNANPIDVKGFLFKNGTDAKAGLVASTLKRDPPGIIAGIPVADLQSPFLNKKRGLYAPNDAKPVFTFKKDDVPFNNLDRIQRGFNDNTPGNAETAGLDAAVHNDSIKPYDKNDWAKTIGSGDAQIFPFMFETINKRGSKRTYAQVPVFKTNENTGEIELDKNKNPIVTGWEQNAGGKEYKQFAFFQATLNSISESYNPTWSSKHFFGRTEQVHSYTMTDRTLEVSFSITVDEIRKLQHLYERVLWLAQQTYASYDENGRMKAGPIIKMTIGDMFSNMTGFIRSLSYDWNYLGGGSPKWEITRGLRIPMACNVSMSFTVMHDVMPDRNHNFYPGPMLHPEGMVSKRGETTLAPWDTGGYAPLISVTDKTDTKVSNNPDVYEVAARNYRNEMFIWQAAENAHLTAATEFV
tara:strand:+ start:714 stop:3113 length:2400 start_codon:yes stop_codon:yes gene_type:complete